VPASREIHEVTVAIHLTEAEVKSILTMAMALESVEDGFRHLAGGDATVQPRHRLHVPGTSYLHYMAAADSADGFMGLKTYTSSRAGMRFLVTLFSTQTGELLALIEGDYLGQMRTGAASGVATRHLARAADPMTLGIIGTGLQAATQIEAVSCVRNLERVRVFGRDAARRARFARETEARLRVKVEPVDSAEKAVRDADIVVTATTSSDPVLDGAWLGAGTHVNAVGSNFAEKRELDDAAMNRAAVIVVDSREQSKMESGDLIHAFGGNESRWDGVVELADVVSGHAPGRTGDHQITLFKSNGIALEDIALAGRIYKIAAAKGMGRSIAFWEDAVREAWRKV
jgi:ornithine cyclodeaminase/alanine dehydrogenase-like protein (mu-crystallin family)